MRSSMGSSTVGAVSRRAPSWIASADCSAIVGKSGGVPSIAGMTIQPPVSDFELNTSSPVPS